MNKIGGAYLNGQGGSGNEDKNTQVDGYTSDVHSLWSQVSIGDVDTVLSETTIDDEVDDLRISRRVLELMDKNGDYQTQYVSDAGSDKDINMDEEWVVKTIEEAGQL